MDTANSADPIDFVITDDVQRIEMWTAMGARAGLDVAAINTAAELFRSAVLVPVCGCAVQRRGTEGFDPDGFMRQSGSFRFCALADVRRAVVAGWLPEQHGAPVTIAVHCTDRTASGTFAAGTMFAVELAVDAASGTEETLRITLSAAFVPAELPGGSSDTRRLGCIVTSVTFHAG